MSSVARRALEPLASLKLTVVLFAMGFFIVFAGTVAQIDKGIWTVVSDYFRCAFAWIDFQIFFPRRWSIPGGFWFPGGWLIGGVLLVNILAAHAIRFKMSARGLRLGAGLVVLAGGALLTALIIAGVFNKGVAYTEDDAFWRVTLRLAKGGGAAIVLWIACVLLFKKRAGIVLLHGGIILLFASEFLTGTTAVEGRMRINAGESKNYVEHMRSAELAFIDRSNPDHDRVIVVPMSRLQRGGTIRDAQLPFDVEVARYMKNSSVIDSTGIPPSMTNPATAGAGLQAFVFERPEVSGTDTEQSVDIPSVYVTLHDKQSGKPLGTYLASIWLEGTQIERQTVTTGDHAYDMTLRFARTYKPYRIELIKFEHDKYVGTEKPKNFSSLVRVSDPAEGVDRTVKIWMNNPLRYAGETFYQSSFEPGKNLTILQVVRNDGWMIPYLSCMIVGVGLAAHFSANLLGFLRRRVSL